MLQVRQIQLVAGKLAGQEPASLRPGDLDEPWRTLYLNIHPPGDPASYEHELRTATASLGDQWPLEARKSMIEAVLETLPGMAPVAPSLYDVSAGLRPIRWLWPGWIPRGLLSLLGAAPGAGKSMLALDLARRVIHRQLFPSVQPAPREGMVPGEGLFPGTGPDLDTQPAPVDAGRFPGGNVIYVDAETIPQIQNERALAWGMDRRKLFLMLPSEAYGMIDFGLKAHQDLLVELVHEVQPRLVIVDSLSSISVRGENNVEDVRAVLQFLCAVARDFDLALLLIHHLRKRGSSLVTPRTPQPVTPDDLRGSTHIITMARSVLALSPVQTARSRRQSGSAQAPDRNGPRRLEVIKTNLCRYPPALGVLFEESDSGIPVLRYTAPSEEHREPTQVTLCAEWLVAHLVRAGKPMRPADVLARASEAGFTKGVVYRARTDLQGIVLNTQTKHSPHNRWLLAKDQNPNP